MSDDTALATTFDTELRLVALDPAQLQASQQKLIVWVGGKISNVKLEMEDAAANLAIAVKSKWNTVRPKAALKLAEQRVTFYEKIRDALMAGYYIVPDFPCDIFAIRTTRNTPKLNYRVSSYRQNESIVPDEQAQLLPSGEGEYQNPQQIIDTRDVSYIDQQGKEHPSFTFKAVDFDSIDFPFALAKPQILDATHRAMTLKIFDEMGVAPVNSQRSTKADPMVLGIIKMPRRGAAGKRLTFLVAWFLDTKTL